MSKQLYLQTAAKAWCTPKTKHFILIPEVTEAFADILEEVWSKPWLGNATTGELIEELKARSNLLYRTVDGEISCKEPCSVNVSPTASD